MQFSTAVLNRYKFSFQTAGFIGTVEAPGPFTARRKASRLIKERHGVEINPRNINLGRPVYQGTGIASE